MIDYMVDCRVFHINLYGGWDGVECQETKKIMHTLNTTESYEQRHFTIVVIELLVPGREDFMSSNLNPMPAW